jgi:nitrite reductase/ring-hydroxylating ferredoxin subunit
MPWTYAATASELSERDVISVECEGRRVALYRLDEGVFATSDVCPHQGASLAEGCVVQGFIECPLHFALFDVRTGEADGAMTTKAVRTYPTRVEHGAIYVDLSDSEETAS